MVQRNANFNKSEGGLIASKPFDFSLGLYGKTHSSFQQTRRETSRLKKKMEYIKHLEKERSVLQCVHGRRIPRPSSSHKATDISRLVQRE